MSQINVAVPDQLYARAKKCCGSAGMYFKLWIQRAIKQAVEREEREAAKDRS
jgi:hypothetical protein